MSNLSPPDAGTLTFNDPASQDALVMVTEGTCPSPMSSAFTARFVPIELRPAVERSRDTLTSALPFSNVDVQAGVAQATLVSVVFEH